MERSLGSPSILTLPHKGGGNFWNERGLPSSPSPLIGEGGGGAADAIGKA
jgi:hypothetical protein